VSKTIRARLLLARFYGDVEPCIVAAIDESIWDHWDDDDEAQWVADGKRLWGIDSTDCEWSQAWAEFAPQSLVDAFVPVVSATARGAEPTESASTAVEGFGETGQ
jgi:hypothetical protein